MTLTEALRAVEPPTESYRTASAICVVDTDQKFRVAWLLDGRRKTAPTGPAFAKPRLAAKLATILNRGHR